MKLHRHAPDGRYLGFIVQDRPIEEYADRTDLTADQPPDAPAGYCGYLVNGAWVLQMDPPCPAPLTRPPPPPTPVVHIATCNCIQPPPETP